MKINTVLGSCDPTDLGPTLVHEHLMTGMPGGELDNPGFDRAREFGKVVDAVDKVKLKGIATLIDPCPMDLGRDPEFAAAVSDKTGMRVIMSTGRPVSCRSRMREKMRRWPSREKSSGRSSASLASSPLALSPLRAAV